MQYQQHMLHLHQGQTLYTRKRVREQSLLYRLGSTPLISGGQNLREYIPLIQSLGYGSESYSIFK